jgi:virginiamycin B lyase
MARSARSILRRVTSWRTLGVVGMLVASTLAAAAPIGAQGRRGTQADAVTYFFVGNLDPKPFMITAGPDGNLWFTDSTADAIGRITPDGVITEFPIGEGKEPYAIVAGADGNLWFTERQNNKVGAVNTDGQLVHEYFVPGPDPRPAGITVAANGDIWFTTQGPGDIVTNAVGRITPGGFMTLYDLYPCACFPTGITAGADGNIWAAEELGVYQGESPGTIDKVTPDGSSVTRYPVPQQPLTPGHLPGFVAPGTDGNVWFTEFASDVHRIGTITPDGQATEYTLPGSLTNSIGVSAGFDGRMWITQGDAGDVVVLNLDGTVQATIPTHHQPSGITMGPDGNMWFAAALDGEIGRISTARSGFGYVLNIVSGFVPNIRTVPMGTTIQWVFEAPGKHNVRDRSGLSLFDSGPKPLISFHFFRFTAAGTFPYVDDADANEAAIAVPMTVPGSGKVGVPFAVQWAVAPPGVGRVFDVQVRRPGSSEWMPWQSGVSAVAASYAPVEAGGYSFRARLRSATSRRGSGWSPPRAVSVA